MSTHRIINLEAPLAATVSAIAEPLSVRQTDILDLIAQGRSNKEIARSLCIAPETVKTHVKHIFVKLNVEKRAQAVSRAYSLGLVGAYHHTTNRLGSPRVSNVEEPNAGFLPPLAPSRPRASDSKAGNLTRPLSLPATARHSSMCRGTITGGRVKEFRFG
jgi:DNA-binding CsgD family transcriptional regulator